MDINPCVKCGSDWINEVYNPGSAIYHWECQQCGNDSSLSMMQNQALEFWNDENGGDEPNLRREFKDLEYNLSRVNSEIEALEAERRDLEEAIEAIKNKFDWTKK